MIFKIFKKKEEVSLPTFSLRDFIAPSSIVIQGQFIKIGERLGRSFYIFSYPRYLIGAWLNPIINLNYTLDLTLHIFPIETGTILKQITRKITLLTVELAEKSEKIRDPVLEEALFNLERLRDNLTSGQEKMFKIGVYITAYGETEKELKEIENTLRSILESKLIYIKPATYQQKEGFDTTAPYGMDKLQRLIPMNTQPLSSFFPFVSLELSSHQGILYGINLHNNSLILFDRFGLENANMVVFAKAGAGKSFMVKTEILRQLMMGVEVLVVDPENEYTPLADAVGGSFINLSLTSPHHINPLDIPTPAEDENAGDVLRSNIINLVGLMRIMLGGTTPEEDAILDRALTETYAARDITAHSDPSTWKEKTPLLSDLEEVLERMEGAESLLRRLRRYTRGTFARFFNQHTNVSLEKPLVIFGIRDMEEELREIAIFLVLRHIWNTVRFKIKKRILVVDEAWWLMKTEDGASFLYGLCKRARKYGLGVTTITQDVSDFLKSPYGQPIISNSSITILLKQHPVSIDLIQKTFHLTDEEKNLLLQCEVGEGIFFAGPQKHVWMRVVASYVEEQIITTSIYDIQRVRSKTE